MKVFINFSVGAKRLGEKGGRLNNNRERKERVSYEAGRWRGKSVFSGGS
jgi:hypothetical protein